MREITAERKSTNGHAISKTEDPSWDHFVEDITPDIAADWLRRYSNERNRNVSRTRVAAYARAMKDGIWIPSPASPLCFLNAGMLGNGHHRLHAVLEASMTVKFVVFRNVPMDHLRFIDTGMSRTAKQIATMFGEDTRFYAPLRTLIALRQGGSSGWISPTEMKTLSERFEADTAKLAPVIKARVAGRPIRAAVLAALILLSSAGENLEPFIVDFCKVCRREDGSTAARNLVRWLENTVGTMAGRGNATDTAAATVSAFQQFAAGAELSYVRSERTILKSFLEKVFPVRGPQHLPEAQPTAHTRAKTKGQ